MKRKITNEYVFYNGEEINNWACDINATTGELESNGGIEHIVEYKGKKYSIITDWHTETIYKPKGKPIEYTNED